MSSPDLPEIVYLNGVRFVRTCEPQRGEELADAQIKALTSGAPVEVKRSCDDGVWRDVKAGAYIVFEAPPEFVPLGIRGQHDAPAAEPEGWMGKPHPVSKQDATNFALRTVGTWRLRTVIKLRNDWWQKLRAAQTPEEKLTCERMITALSEAIGLHQHELGAQLCKDNPHTRSDREVTEEERAERERREVNKWR